MIADILMKLITVHALIVTFTWHWWHFQGHGPFKGSDGSEILWTQYLLNHWRCLSLHKYILQSSH